MPNWCDNTVTLRHSDKSKIDALATVLKNNDDERMLNHLRPNPSGEWDYNWSVENWGTKWDITPIDWERNGDNEIWVSFESAWAPPTRLYEYLVDEGWKVDAIYNEPGMGYGGVFTTEDGDDYYEYDLSDPDQIENLPSDLIEFADLRTRAEEYALDMIIENWGDAERTDWFPMSINPVHIGYYEVKVKGYDEHQYEQYVKFDGVWDFYNVENLIGWRGLTENHND